MITFDEGKRAKTLAERGLDFVDAAKVFAGHHFTRPDERKEYGEPRFITIGRLAGRFVVVTWTPRDGGWRIISMRCGHEREEDRFRHHLG